MKVFLTGATGYVGEAVAGLLVAQGHTVVGLTRDPRSSRASALEDAGVRVVAGDVGDAASYRARLAAAEVVIHTVADGRRPVKGDERLFDELLALRAAGRAPHLVYTTGCSVYGAHSHPLLDESTPTDPDHPRARLEARLATSGLAHTIVRPAFVFGGDGRSSLLGRWLDEARDGVAVFYGDAAKVWSWVHVDDLARGYAAVVEHLAELDGEAFLLADDAPVAAREAYEACQRAFGRTGPVTHAPISEEAPVYQVFDRDEVVDSSRARRLLGWTPQAVTVAELIAAVPGRAATHPQL
ncbi:NAD-dependent epimerase/dehydratase family protein [Nocardioides sp. AX2bis]|uniref:NAD-dependent epimerase/dehydratase family protein n=1 Tax=Nocardioides sp. AX2bis TaxID=2653157 RepID=UPI0012EFA86C|nr:NAD-dependent epimerase/dehydratase family protein [Nocardioides sp. AX2bis]VXC53745.1 putative UDP-glucose 4-epimerase [Nocardioides sp. AX2bis]